MSLCILKDTPIVADSAWSRRLLARFQSLQGSGVDPKGMLSSILDQQKFLGGDLSEVQLRHKGW
jgi:hypothetical protein